MENTLVLLVIVLVRMGSSTVHNDATEALDRPMTAGQGQAREQPVQEDSNQARNGGRKLENVRSGPDQSQVGCRELRSTKYISDGQCTSVNPIKELVCAGECLPSHLLPNWIGGASHTGRYWSRRDTVEWRCVIDRTRTQRIRLQCEDGSSRTYKITVVTSCKCKRYSRQQNDSAHKDLPHRDLTLLESRRRSQKKTGLPEEQTA
ncbi:sclerostin domain-containing protein 1b [Eucyclogobius newberryi]|uniref:sclerostin domain-containing protein 1b n=1 Tax=Eucyclogobius newberryi TaxID=166745 RepID=UPI003B58DEE4